MFGQLPTREPVAPSNLRRTSSPAPLDYADVSTPRTPRGLLRSNSSVRSSPQFGRRARAESAERQGSLEKSGRMKNNVEKTHMLRHAGDAQKDGARPYQGPGKITPRTPQAVKTEAVVKPAPTAFDYHMQLVRAQLPTQGTRLPSAPGPGTAVAGSNVESAARAANCDASSDTSEEPWRWQRFEGGWRWERKNHKPKSILQYGNFPVKSSNNNQNFEEPAVKQKSRTPSPASRTDLSRRSRNASPEQDRERRTMLMEPRAVRRSMSMESSAGSHMPNPQDCSSQEMPCSPKEARIFANVPVTMEAVASQSSPIGSRRSSRSQLGYSTIEEPVESMRNSISRWDSAPSIPEPRLESVPQRSESRWSPVKPRADPKRSPATPKAEPRRSNVTPRASATPRVEHRWESATPRHSRRSLKDPPQQFIYHSAPSHEQLRHVRESVGHRRESVGHRREPAGHRHEPRRHPHEQVHHPAEPSRYPMPSPICYKYRKPSFSMDRFAESTGKPDLISHRRPVSQSTSPRFAHSREPYSHDNMTTKSFGPRHKEKTHKEACAPNQRPKPKAQPEIGPNPYRPRSSSLNIERPIIAHPHRRQNGDLQDETRRQSLLCESDCGLRTQAEYSCGGTTVMSGFRQERDDRERWHHDLQWTTPKAGDFHIDGKKWAKADYQD